MVVLVKIKVFEENIIVKLLDEKIKFEILNYETNIRTKNQSMLIAQKLKNILSPRDNT